MSSEFSLTRIDKQRFRPAAEVEDILDDLRRNLISGEKYRVARLAIARSLSADEEVETLPKGTEMGSSIEGQTLFGDDAAVWACLVVEGSSRLIATVEEFRSLVEAHWTRGARLLQEDLENADMRSPAFINTLASMARQSSGSNQNDLGTPLLRSGAVFMKVGEIGRNVKTQADVAVTINAPGVSPHAAVLGKTRSGKTRTGIVMAEQILANSELPFLLIDPKGEFVREGEFVRKSEWGGKSLADRFSGIQAVDVPRQVVPLDFLYRSPGALPVDLAQTAMSFRDSFQKCLRAKGDIALDSFREIVQKLLSDVRDPVSLAVIRDAVSRANEDSGRKKDTIEAKLNELCTLKLFEPVMAPAQFFNKRWAIGLSDATEESRRLVMFLLLDSLSKHLLGMRDSDTDGSGFRALRHVLVIDEAKEILSYRHNALGNLIRKSAAKGGVIMLLSQSPDDFEQEDEDFLAQIGSVVVFSSSTNSVKNLRAAFGRRLAPESFSDKELPRGVAWAKLPNMELMKVAAWE